MRLIVDTNILFSLFKLDSRTSEYLDKKEIYLAAPEFAISELKKHSSLIIEKSGISKRDFQIILENMDLKIAIVPLEEYEPLLEMASKISPDKTDIDFFALAMLLKCPIWSNDSKLKEQNKIDVINTQELIQLLS